MVGLGGPKWARWMGRAYRGELITRLQSTRRFVWSNELKGTVEHVDGRFCSLIRLIHP